MKTRPFEQLWQVRRLVEDLIRRDLTNRTAELGRLEKAAERQQTLALASRREVLEGLGESGEPKDWLLGLADADILEWRSERLRGHAEAEKPKVAAARDELLERRRERLQAETLVEAARRADERERERREQQRTDDWFQGRTKRGDPE